MEQPNFVVLLLLMLVVTGSNGIMVWRVSVTSGSTRWPFWGPTMPAQIHICLADSDECLWQNQGSYIREQFVEGIRYFDIDTCWHENQVKNCHCNSNFGCQYGGGVFEALRFLDVLMQFSIPYFYIEYRYEVNSSSLQPWRWHQWRGC